MGLANETVSWPEMIPSTSKVQPLSPLVCEIPLWELLPVLEQGPPPQYSWRPTTPVLMETWEKKRVDKVAMPHGRGSRELPGILTTLECGWGARLSVTYVINYFLTISSVSAS